MAADDIVASMRYTLLLQEKRHNTKKEKREQGEGRERE